jgi:hypothetical protein
VVVTVFVVQVPPVQFGELYCAVLLIVPGAVVDATVTENVSASCCPATRPAPTIQVIVEAETLAEQVGVVVADSAPQLTDPGTRTVPVGTVSVTVTGTAVVGADGPFSTVRV